MKRLIFITLLGVSSLLGKSNTEKLGDFLTFAVPAAAYGSTFYFDDDEGRTEFYKAYGATMLSTVALKHTVRAKRPDNDDRDSFPSGHTASAVSGAVFMHKRYGFAYALPLYVGAIYTGYSRIHVNRHHPRDVLAGTVVGALSSWYFTTPNEKFHITPIIDSAYKGISINYRF
jgi:membrane-associated phospholipid phosphatase